MLTTEKRRRSIHPQTPFLKWLRLVLRATRPTGHLPFSKEKIRVMRLRAALKLPLHVRGDEPMPAELQDGAEAAGRTSLLAG